MPRFSRLFLLLLLLATCLGIGRLGGGDLQVYRSAGALAHAGEPLRAYWDSAKFGNFFDGPVFLVFASWLSTMPAETVKWFWLGVETLAFLIFWVGFLRLFPKLWKGAPFLCFFAAWVSSIKPIHATFQSFNLQLILIAVMVVSERMSRSRKAGAQFVAGFLLPFLAVWKIFPAFVLVYALLTKTKSTRYGIYFGAALALAIPLFRFGPHEGALLYAAFFRQIAHYHHAYPLADQVISLSLPSLIATWGRHWDPLVLNGVLLATIVGISSMFYAAVIFERRKGPLSADWWALALALMAFLNSGSRPDYFVFYVPAFASVFLAWGEGALSRSARFATVVSLGLIAFISEWTLQSRDLTHYLEGLRVPVLGMILLCGILMLTLFRGTPHVLDPSQLKKPV